MARVTLWLLLLLGWPAGPGSAGERPARANEEPASRPALAQVRASLQSRASGDHTRSLGPVSLDGFNWAREIELGEGWTAEVVSCNLGGGILVFDPQDQFAGARRTWEISALQLFDLDEDGIHEIVAEQRDGVGTAVARWNYHIYRASSAGLAHLWSGQSWSYFGAESAGAGEESQGFVRFVPSGWGDRQTKLVHVIGPLGGGPLEQHVYVFVDGAFVERDRIMVPSPVR